MGSGESQRGYPRTNKNYLDLFMPIDAGDLVKSEEREIINSSASDLNVEAAGGWEKLGEKWEQGKGVVGEVAQNIGNKVDTLARRDFFKVIKFWGLRIGLPVLILATGFIMRGNIVEFVNYLGSRVSIVEEKPEDPRIAKAFGEDYQKEARTQGTGQYSLYLMGNSDENFDLSNIPKPGEKDNVVWYLTEQYGTTWPFVTQERDKDMLDPDLFTVAEKQVFIDKISNDLGLSEEQRADLKLRYESLSRDPAAVLQWLKDLQKQGIKAVTDDVIKYYADPVGYVTGN